MADLVPLLNFVSIQEAHQIRNMLDAEGVSAFVEGEQASSMMPHVGAVAGVRLLVTATHLARAKRILSDARAEADSAKKRPAWFCGTCQEIIESGFNVCWSCGGLRDDVEDPDVDVSKLNDEDEHVEEEPEHALDSGLDAANPYAASGLSARGPHVVEERLSEELEAQLSRAWRAALLGLAFVPILMSCYSGYLLMTLRNRALWPDSAVRRLWGTLAVNVFAIVLWATIGVFFLLS